MLRAGRRLLARGQAAPGDLDPTFSGDGKQTTDFGGSDEANGLALQTDGKIVAVGTGGTATSGPRPLQPRRDARPELLRRRQADDQLRGFDQANGVALQADGKIVAVGGPAATAATSRSPATTRTARSTRASPATASRRPTSGISTTRTGWRSRATARSSWSATTATGSDGLRARPLQPQRLARHELLRRRQADDRLREQVLRGATGWRSRADGKIVAVGEPTEPAATSPSPATTPTARSTRASPATASRRPTSGATTEASGVALQGDGKIVAVGAAAALPASDFALARYNPNGSLDTSFSGDGKQTTDFGGVRRGERRWRSRRTARSSRSAAATASRPRRLRARPLQPQRLARHELLRRRQADDRLRGRATGERGGAPGRRQDRRGRAAPRGPGYDFALARYNPNGSLDTELLRRRQADDRLRRLSTTRRTGWRSRATARSSWSAATALAADRLRARPLQPQRLARHELLRRRQADDRLRGQSDDGERRWRSRATARSSWSGGGPGGTGQRLRPRPLQPQRLARHDLLRRRQADDRLRRLDEANGVAIQGDGKIVAVGDRSGTGGDFALARYNPNGSLDTSFSGDGKQTTDFGAASTRRTGWRSRATARSSRSAHWRPRTATSRSPATTRTARSTRASPATASRRPTSGGSDVANGVALQGDGKIVAVGASDPAAADDFALARYNPNGSLDTSFSGDGKQTTDFGGSTTGERGGAPGRRQDRRGRASRAQKRRLRPRPLQPQRLARHELLRRRQADDRLRWDLDPGSENVFGFFFWRSRATARSSRPGLASARAKPRISRLLAIWGAERGTADWQSRSERSACRLALVSEAPPK